MSATGTARAFDAVVIGSDIDALTAATTLARAGRKVLLAEEGDALGGALREIEFAPGYRAAPLAPVLDPTLVALGDGEPLLLPGSPAQSAVALQRRSPRDAGRWPVFCRRMQSLAGFLAELYRVPPPRIDARGFGEFLALMQLGRKYRRLGRGGMVELLHTLPMPIADLLDDEFETPVLKGALAAFGVTDLAQGPAAAGTAFTFLHRLVAPWPANRESPAPGNAGIAARIEAHAARARAGGVVIATATKVHGLDVRDGRVIGVRLGSGPDFAASGQITCGTVVSSLDPYRSLLGLVDPRHHDPHFIHAVRNIRFRGVASKVLVALDGLPAIAGLPPSAAAAAAEMLRGSLFVAPSLRYVERAYEATKYGRCSEQPFIEVQFPTLQQPGLAPAGGHVAVLHVQYTPYRLREGAWDSLREPLADRAIAAVDAVLPGFAGRVRARTVLAPPDLEARFGVREGAVSQGEMMLDQILFMRPVPTASDYTTPIAGYHLCGAGTHPGAGVYGVSGDLAARAAIAGSR